jgi:hypothetical protein
MISFYFCAGTSMAEDLEVYKSELEGTGHLVVSRWHSLHDPRLELTDNEDTLRGRAFVDLLDIKGSNIVVAFSSSLNQDPFRKPSGRGGHHFELGFAYASGFPIWLIGDPEHAFHSLVARQFESWAEFMADL